MSTTNLYGEEVTTTSNTQAQTNYEAAADVILAILNDFNFYTDTKFDPKELKRKIVKAIQVSVEGNTNAPITG